MGFEIEVSLEEIAELVILLILLVGISSIIFWVKDTGHIKSRMFAHEASYIVSIVDDTSVSLDMVENTGMEVKNNYLSVFYKNKFLRNITVVNPAPIKVENDKLIIGSSLSAVNTKPNP